MAGKRKKTPSVKGTPQGAEVPSDPRILEILQQLEDEGGPTPQLRTCSLMMLLI
jgi:hypothetical protein